MVLYQYTVVNHRQCAGLRYLAICVETWLFQREVKALPFARPATNTNYRWILAVNGGSLSVSVRFILERVKNLQFLMAWEKYATVSSILP